MKVFDRIPDKFFSILTSSKKELYVEALFVLRQAFKTELVIRRIDLVAMIIEALEMSIIQSDFSEEIEELDASNRTDATVSGKAYLIIRKLKETGWLEVEYESNSFEENITIPDYSISIINLLYDITKDQKIEYNSYVFATYAALKNSEENPDYLYQALQSAYHNTVRLVDELKLLYNNIKRYYQRITVELSVNELLAEHFDSYKEHIIDTIYYPLKTIDSVPRFKNSILICLNKWVLDDDIIIALISQGKQRRIYSSGEEGREDVLEKINYIANTFENIEGMIADIDNKHVEYTNASIDRIRYMMNSDRSIKGKLVELLKHSKEAKVFIRLQEAIVAYQHGFMDESSLYNRVRNTIKTEGKPKAIDDIEEDRDFIESFLDGVRKQYSTQKIDEFIDRNFAGNNAFSTKDLAMESQDEFILLILGTIRGSQNSASFYVEFLEGIVEINGYRVPKLNFHRKGRS